jgi:hypothetical protein
VASRTLERRADLARLPDLTMATPRKRWFRVADEIGRKPWDNDLVATYMRLSAFMNSRWARDGLSAAEAGRVALRKADVCTITDKHRSDVARKSLERLAEVEPMSVEHQGDITVINWPNFPIFQNYDPQIREDHGHENALSAIRFPQHASRDTRKDVAPPEWASRLAQRLADEVEDTVPGAAIPSTLAPWATEIARIDRPEAEIAATIDWLFSAGNTGKYAIDVQSGRALRKKYGQIRVRMNRAQHPARTAPEERDERARQKLAEIDKYRERVERESPEERARAIEESRNHLCRRKG